MLQRGTLLLPTRELVSYAAAKITAVREPARMNPMITQMRNSVAVTFSSFLKVAMLLNMQMTKASKPPRNPPPRKLVSSSTILLLCASCYAVILYTDILIISCVISIRSYMNFLIFFCYIKIFYILLTFVRKYILY